MVHRGRPGAEAGRVARLPLEIRPGTQGEAQSAALVSSATEATCRMQDPGAVGAAGPLLRLELPGAKGRRRVSGAGAQAVAGRIIAACGSGRPGLQWLRRRRLNAESTKKLPATYPEINGPSE